MWRALFRANISDIKRGSLRSAAIGERHFASSGQFSGNGGRL